MKSLPNKSGFTLVELLVVISIIAILSVIGITVFSGAQKSARDAKRKGDARAIVTALEMYKSINGVYPCFGVSQTCPAGVEGWFYPTGLLPLSPIYMQTIPNDPLFNGTCSITNKAAYLYAVTGNGPYTLYINLENANDASALAVKPPPSVHPNTSASIDGYKTFRIDGGTCGGVTFNYWINSSQ